MEAITDKWDTATAMIGATKMRMKKIINYMEYVKEHFIPVWCPYNYRLGTLS